jgi:hypothetical protein
MNINDIKECPFCKGTMRVMDGNNNSYTIANSVQYHDILNCEICGFTANFHTDKPIATTT